MQTEGDEDDIFSAIEKIVLEDEWRFKEDDKLWHKYGWRSRTTKELILLYLKFQT